jgi:tetratricopeptide (TPR) repeat protein
MSEEINHWVWFVEDELIGALLEADPHNPEVRKRSACSPALAKAIALYLQSKPVEAIAELASGLARGEDPGDLHAAAGQIHFELGQMEDAAQSYASATGSDRGRAASWYNLGICLERLNQWESAEEALRNAIELGVSTPAALLSLGRCSLHVERADQALDAFDACLKQSPEDLRALFGRAVALQQQGRLDEAVESYEQYLEREPESDEAWHNLLAMALSRGDKNAAGKYASRLGKAHLESPAGLSALASSAFSSREYTAAADYCRQLVRQSPDCYEAWFNLGIACQELGAFDEAADAYARATQIRPDARVNLATASRDLGDGAWRALEKALEANPNSVPALRGLADLAIERGDLKRALALQSKLSELGQLTPELLYNVGVLYQNAGELEEAARCYRGALEKTPRFSEALLNLGHALKGLGAERDAQTCWKQALELNPDLARQYFRPPASNA